MAPAVSERLLNINREFYRQFAASFAESRNTPQPGFFELVPFLPRRKNTVLDVGCGEGRFGRFLARRQAVSNYTGLDFTEELLQIAAGELEGEFYARDFSLRGWQKDLRNFDIVACLATLQHIPGVQRRSEILTEMAELLEPNGRIFLSLWQFLDSRRQRRKIVPWEEVSLTTGDVDPNDYLLSWDRDGSGFRYVAFIDINSLEDLAVRAGVTIEHSFRSDGKEGNLNLYAILSRN